MGYSTSRLTESGSFTLRDPRRLRSPRSASIGEERNDQRARRRVEILEKVVEHDQSAVGVLDGPIVQRGALPEERGEPELANLARLAMTFDRRHHGRLRQLIDAVNAAPSKP